MRRCRWLVLLLVCYPILLIAQEKMIHAVYLKTGYVVKGYILEMIPDSTIKVLARDSSLYILDVKDVDKVVSEQRSMDEHSSNSSNGIQKRAMRRSIFYGGLTIPSGKIASDGMAKTGWTLGIQNLPTAVKGFMYDGDITVNHTQKSNTDSWISLFLMTGYKVTIIRAGHVSVNYSPMLGGAMTMEQAAAFSLAYGFQVNAQMFSRFSVSARFLGCNPRPMSAYCSEVLVGIIF